MTICAKQSVGGGRGNMKQDAPPPVGEGALLTGWNTPANEVPYSVSSVGGALPLITWSSRPPFTTGGKAGNPNVTFFFFAFPFVETDMGWQKFCKKPSGENDNNHSERDTRPLKVESFVQKVTAYMWIWMNRMLTTSPEVLIFNCMFNWKLSWKLNCLGIVIIKLNELSWYRYY